MKRIELLSIMLTFILMQIMFFSLTFIYVMANIIVFTVIINKGIALAVLMLPCFILGLKEVIKVFYNLLRTFDKYILGSNIKASEMLITKGIQK